MDDWRSRITMEAGKRSGKPTIRGMRIAVSDVLGMLATEMTAEDVLRAFDELEPADIKACMAYAAEVTSMVRVAPFEGEPAVGP